MRAHVDVDEVVDLTCALVAVDTRNPPGDERAVAGVCRDALDPFRAAFQEIEPAPGRLSLVATVPHPAGDALRPTLIVNGHLDVVPIDPRGWEHDPFRPEVDNGRLYGRGTADMKGGIAAAIAALGTMARAGRAPGCNLVFHLVADEERGGELGTHALVNRGLVKGDACLVPEPTSLQVCIAERGLLVVDVIIHGRPGHGSAPRQGVSAIEHAAAVVLAVHAADFGDAAHPLLGTPTANVGEIEGGSGHNTVPERCRLVVDRRLLPGTTKEEAIAGIRQRIDAAGVHDLHYDLDIGVFGEASELDRDHPFVATVRRAVAAATGQEPPIIGMSFTTDARFVRNMAGVAAVVCGPGDVEQAHVNDEWVSVDRLADATAAYAELFASFGAEG